MLKKLPLIITMMLIALSGNTQQAKALLAKANKQYKKAEKYYLKTITPNKPIHSQSQSENTTRFEIYLASYLTLIHFYIKTGQFQKAQHCINNIPDSLDKYATPQYLISINLMRFKVDSAFGNYVSAIKYYQKYKNMNDTIFHAKAIGAAEETQIKYEAVKKEQSIKILEGDRNIQKMQVQKAVIQRNVTLAAIIIILGLTGISYYGYRRKKISNLLIGKKNNQLEILLSEKNWLLKEVHHRVKNNLHTVFCLLESQAKFLTDDALKAVEITQHRIYSMSLIHQKLYQSNDIKTVDMVAYLSEFIKYLGESFNTDEHIKFKLTIEPIKLSVSQAIPIALIINEAVTNAIKYAFPENKAGIIEVTLKLKGEEVLMEVRDNGIGINPFVEKIELKSLGISLMQGLARDVNGQFKVTNNGGTIVEVVFPIIAE